MNAAAKTVLIVVVGLLATGGAWAQCTGMPACTAVMTPTGSFNGKLCTGAWHVSTSGCFSARAYGMNASIYNAGWFTCGPNTMYWVPIGPFSTTLPSSTLLPGMVRHMASVSTPASCTVAIRTRLCGFTRFTTGPGGTLASCSFSTADGLPVELMDFEVE